MSLTLLQIVLVAVLAVFAAVMLRRLQPDISMLLCLAIGILLLFYIVQSFQEVRNFLQMISGGLNLDYIGILVKLLGIAYLCEFASGLCKDAGYQSVSGQIEIAGRVGMIMISLPVLRAIIETIYGFFG